MAQPKLKTKFPGVRYRESVTRPKHGSVNRDRYYTIRYKVDGKDKEEMVGWSSEGMTPEKAYAILSEIRENIRLGRGPQSLAEKRAANRDAEIREKELQEKEAGRKVTFGKFFSDVYLPNAEIIKKPSSMKAEKGYYRKWISPVIENICFNDIEYLHVDKIISNMNEQNRAGRTKNYVLSIISQTWNYAKNYKIIDKECPTERRSIKKLNNERTRFLSEEEAEALLEELKKHSIDVHDMAVFALFCGLRAGEIFNLKWSDINMDEKSIKLLHTKSSKTRYAWFGPKIEGILKERLKSSPSKDDLIFIGYQGKKHVVISNTFTKCVNIIGLNDNVTDRKEKIVFHSLRHTFASWLAKKGVPAYNIMKLMGHSSYTMMQRYAHLTDNTLKNSASVLNDILDNKEKINKQENKDNNKET